MTETHVVTDAKKPRRLNLKKVGKWTAVAVFGTAAAVYTLDKVTNRKAKVSVEAETTES